MPDNTLTIVVARELVEQYAEWTDVRSLGPCWFRVVPQGDGTADVQMCTGSPSLESPDASLHDGSRTVLGPGGDLPSE